MGFEAGPEDGAHAGIDPRLAALGLTSDSPEPLPVERPAQPAAPPPAPELPPYRPTPPPEFHRATPPDFRTAPAPEPPRPSPPVPPSPPLNQAGRIPGSYVPPSGDLAPQQGRGIQPSSGGTVAGRPVGTSPSLSVGARPVSMNMAPPVPSKPAEPVASWQGAAAAAAPADGRTGPVSANGFPWDDNRAQGPAAPPLVPIAPAAPFAAAPEFVPPAVPSPALVASAIASAPASKPTAKPWASLTRRELIPLCLCLAGAGLGIACLFLPWTGWDGIGVGTSTPHPARNQWAFAMPAGFPIFLLTALVMAALAGSDRAQAELPKLAAAIGRVTDIILPMVLGSLYLGVALLYVTFPWGYGVGIVALLIAAILLISGSVVTLFFPQEARPKAE